MNALVLEFPESLRAVVAGEALRRGVSESAWLEEAAREVGRRGGDGIPGWSRGAGESRRLRGSVGSGARRATRTG
jgi:hypothetical protein